MTDWTIVLWNDARQIAQQAGLTMPLTAKEDTSPQAFFEALRKEEHISDALLFIATSLPRLESITWAVKSMPHPPSKNKDYNARRHLRDLAQRWVDEPDDANRRAVHDAAQASPTEWPETLLGLAIFFSGGSIAPLDLAPVSADASLTGNLAAAALQTAAIENMKNYKSVMNQALDLGHQVAMHGREAFA